MTCRLMDTALVIRSKNSGPFELTLDVMFRCRRDFDAFRASGVLTAERVAALYGLAPADIMQIVWFHPANAVKVTLRRPRPSGAPGDSDVYGAQQHAPLLDLTYPA